MHQGLPVSVFIESVSWGSSELEFWVSVNSTVLVRALEESPSGFWVSSYIPSANDVVSICNAMIGN